MKGTTLRGKMSKSGDVVIARIQFADSPGSKVRPALVLFEELGNIVVAGITTNTDMRGVFISNKDGAAQDSIIKVNYLFTLSKEGIIKTVFHLGAEKRGLVYNELTKLLSHLKD